MELHQSLSHTKWDCKYHIVWIPKYRRKVLYGESRRYLGDVLRYLARQKEGRVLEGHLMPDHVQMLLSIPPKYEVAQVVGFVKGKSAIYVVRNFGNRGKNFTGEKFWARGCFMSTCGKDDEEVKEYIKHQEQEDKRLDQLKLFE
ncbi:transposase [uncultured Desulfobacterium sp.]|uniref:Transposase n=1 Tax=uncultured Desulfobacterium sp. TaxID=201089 RepID=A0A445MSA0_9BACT|nr:transposase [uncultured Desulfobacterium sp.]